MPRFSVSITEEQNEWVEQEAEARDRSKSEIIRYLIDAHRGEHDQSDSADRDSGEASDLDARLQQISDRLTALETALVEDQSQVAESGSQSGQDDKSQAARTVQSPRRESAVTTEGKTSASPSSAEDQVSQDTKSLRTMLA